MHASDDVQKPRRVSQAAGVITVESLIKTLVHKSCGSGSVF